MKEAKQPIYLFPKQPRETVRGTYFKNYFLTSGPGGGVDASPPQETIEGITARSQNK